MSGCVILHITVCVTQLHVHHIGNVHYLQARTTDRSHILLYKGANQLSHNITLTLLQFSPARQHQYATASHIHIVELSSLYMVYITLNSITHTHGTLCHHHIYTVITHTHDSCVTTIYIYNAITHTHGTVVSPLYIIYNVITHTHVTVVSLPNITASHIH